MSEYVEAASKLNGRTLADAVEGYLSTVASVTRKDVAIAVEEFIKASEPLTKAADGQRAQAILAKLGYAVAIEAGAGEGARFADEAYRQAGAAIVASG